MDRLNERAEELARRLQARGEKIAVVESSAGGLISAPLVGVAGASAYYLGSMVIYTQEARAAFLGVRPEDLSDIRPSTEPYARLLGGRLRELVGADWVIAETGASGPTGNRYGDAPGHACLAVLGATESSRTLETASDDRRANMFAFAEAAFDLALETIAAP